MGDGTLIDGGNNDSGNTPDDSESNEDDSWLSGALSGVTDWLKSIWESISSIPDKIVNGFKNLIEGLKEFIKDIFVPDENYIQQAFMGFVDELKMKFGVDTTVFESIFNNESAVADISGNYSINGVGTFELKFLDVTYLVQGVTHFRPFIRGFIVLLLFIFNIRQLISFFGGNSGADAEKAVKGE